MNPVLVLTPCVQPLPQLVARAGVQSAKLQPSGSLRFLARYLALSLAASCVFGQYLNWTVTNSGGDGGPADIKLMRSRVTITAPSTYFELTGWNAGMPAGGYMGIQDASTGGGNRCGSVSSGRNYIFSLWDPPSGGKSFVVYSTPTGSACHGTGEGGTVGYLNYAMPWQLGAWYRFAVRAWNYNSNTYFGFWSFDEDAATWTHHATLGYPAPDIVMVNGESAFLEYFGPGGDPTEYEKRRVEYNDNWVRSPSKSWVPLGYAQFTAASGFGQGAYDAGVQNGAYYLQAGGDTTPTLSSGTFLSLPLANTSPTLSIGRTISASATYNGIANQLTVSWISDPTVSPQFAYKVDVFDNPSWTGNPVFTQSDIAPHVRSIDSKVDLALGNTYYVRVTTTDIFDQVAQPVSTTISTLLTTNTKSMNFNATVAGGVPAPQPLSVATRPSAVFTANISEESCSASNWLSISPLGSLSATDAITNIAVSVNPAGIAGGTACNGTITLAASGATQTVSVKLVVDTQVIYTTFGMGQTFSSGGSCVSGQSAPGCGPLVTRWIAAPFTPDGNFTLSSLDIAIGNLGGTPGAIVMLVNSTSAGAPGTALEQWTLSNLPNTAQAAITSLASQLVPTLKAGQTYWVVAQGSADDSMDFWQASDVGLTGGMDNVSQDGWHTFSAPAPAFDVRGNPANDGAELLTVSATGDGYWLAQESIAVAYGENLAPSIAVAITQPLPITLGGVTVTVKDSAGVARPAGLYYVSPGEIVYVVPAGTAAGPAGVTVGQSSGAAFIAPVAPRLFSANGNGQGVAAASAVRVSSSGEQDPVPVFHCQSVGCTSMPLDLGATTDTLEVQLYGTGIRGVSALSKVVAQIGGVSTPVTLAGPQGQLEGLDQVNVEVPRSLAGAGEVPIVLIVDGIAANVVTVNIK